MNSQKFDEMMLEVDRKMSELLEKFSNSWLSARKEIGNGESQNVLGEERGYMGVSGEEVRGNNGANITI